MFFFCCVRTTEDIIEAQEQLQPDALADATNDPQGVQTQNLEMARPELIPGLKRKQP